MAEVYNQVPRQGALFAGRYRIEKLLGEGAMGKVFLARDSMLANECVALKVLHQNLCADERHTKRFLREIQLTRKITHANIVRTFEIGSQDGWLFFSMEYAPGRTLRDLIHEGPLEPKQAGEILLEVAKGLAAIHAAGIIHRDLKPGNVIYTPDQKVKITDFGIARPDASDLTGHDELLGSIRYLAPECWMGKDVGPLADIYALGVVAYELLTGIVPFDGEGAAELMFKHLQAKPLPPSTLLKQVPPWADELVLRLLEKEQRKRPDALELISLIERREETERENSCAAPEYDLWSPETAGDCCCDTFASPAALPGEWSGNQPPPAQCTEAVSSAVRTVRAVRKPAGADSPEASGKGGRSPSCGPYVESDLPQPERQRVFGRLPDRCNIPGNCFMRLLLAFGVFAFMSLLVAVPLAFMARAMWRWSVDMLGSSWLLFGAGSLAVLAAYALMAAVPLACLSLVALPLKRLPSVWLQIGIYLMLVLSLLAVVNTGRLVSVWSTAQDRFNIVTIVAGWKEGVRAAAGNAVEASALLPHGSHYGAYVGSDGPVLVEDGSWLGALLYYAILIAYLYGLLEISNRSLPDREKNGSPFGLILAALGVMCLLEHMLLRPVTSSSAWKVVSAAAESGAGVAKVFDNYALMCGMINWLVVVCIYSMMSAGGGREKQD